MERLNLGDAGLSEKEQKILESAIMLFSEKGFTASTTSEIAKGAGVAEGTIFRYFKTKKDILRGILIQAINIISTKFVLGPVEKIIISSAEKDLKAILKELLLDRLKLAESIFPMMRVIITEALYHEDVRDALYENIIANALKIFTDFHNAMIEKGILRDDVKTEVLFRSILGNMTVFIAQRMLFGYKFSFDDIEAELDNMIDVLLYGIAVNRD